MPDEELQLQHVPADTEATAGHGDTGEGEAVTGEPQEDSRDPANSW